MWGLSSQAWQHRPVIPATQEVEAEELKAPDQPALSEFKARLGNLVKPSHRVVRESEGYPQ